MMKKYIFSLIVSCGVIIASATPSINELRDSITDADIVLPTSFETDYEELQKNWYIQNYIDLTEPKEKRGIVSELNDKIYIERLQRLQNEMGFEIELPFNNVVKSHIEMYTSPKRRNLVERILGMWLYYEPIFEAALAKEELPLELKYLPIIESALNPNAVSPAGAVGLWQFILPTGRGMGLEINSLVDERRDTYKASQKAAEFLKSLYKTYNNWSLAIAAYNCGPGNVNKAIRRSGGGKKDFWEIYNYLPKETRGYVPAFIAAAYVMNYHNEQGINAALAKKPLLTDTVHISRRLHFNQIANVIDLSTEALEVLNPQYRKSIIPGSINKPYVLILPSKQVYSYLMSENSIAQYNAEEYALREIAEPGVDKTISANDSSSNNNDVNLSNNKRFTSKEEIITHVVRRGESLKSIANKYGTNTSRIKKDNKLTSNTIKRGQKLKITTYKKVLAENNSDVNRDNNVQKNKSNSKATDKRRDNSKANTNVKSSNPKTHTVKSGESLDRIARRYGVSVEALRRANNIKKSNDKIHPGDKLKIPSKNNTTKSKSSSKKQSKKRRR